jgi:hypothetical protein
MSGMGYPPFISPLVRGEGNFARFLLSLSLTRERLGEGK